MERALLCVGLIGPYPVCRQVWRHLHEATLLEHTPRGSSYVKSLIVELPLGGIPFTEVLFVGRPGERLPLETLASAAEDEFSPPPTIVLFRSSHAARLAGLCNDPALQAFELSLHVAAPGPAEEEALRAALAAFPAAHLQRYPPTADARAIAAAIRTEIGDFALRSGNYGSACGY